MAQERNLQLEQQRLQDFAKQTGGKMPSTSADWQKFATMVYGSDLPTELAQKFSQQPVAPTTGTTPTTGTAPTTPPLMSNGVDISEGALAQARAGAEQFSQPANFLDRIKGRLQEKFKPESETLGIGSFSETLGPLDPAALQRGITEKSGQFARKGQLALQALSTGSQLYSEQAQIAQNKLNTLLEERNRYDMTQKETEQELKALALSVAQTGQEIPQEILSLLPADMQDVYAKLPGIFATTQQTPNLVEIDGKQYEYNPETGTYTKPVILSSDLKKDPVTGAPTDPNSLILGYNFTSWAMDETWENSVKNKLAGIGKFNTLSDVDNYIKSKYPNSPLTGEIIGNVSAKYGIPWELLTAIAEHESYLGTSPVARKNNNFGGITWNGSNGQKGTARPSAEDGYYVKYNSVQEGLDAYAYNIARRKQVEKTQDPASMTKNDLILAQVRNGLITKTQLSNIIDQSDDPEFIAQLQQVVESPKNKSIAESQAEMYHTPTNLTRGQFDTIIAEREKNGFGNKYFQGIGEKEYEKLQNWFGLQRDLVDIQALRQGGEYIKNLPQDEKERIFIKYGDVLGADTVEELESIGATSTGPVEAAFSAEFLGFPNERNVAIESITGKYTADYMKSISGVAISEEEALRLQKFLPSLNQQEERYDRNAKNAMFDLNKKLDLFAQKSGFNDLGSLKNGTYKMRSGAYYNIDENVIDSFNSYGMSATDTSDELLNEVLGDVESPGYDEAEAIEFLENI